MFFTLFSGLRLSAQYIRFSCLFQTPLISCKLNWRMRHMILSLANMTIPGHSSNTINFASANTGEPQHNEVTTTFLSCKNKSCYFIINIIFLNGFAVTGSLFALKQHTPQFYQRPTPVCKFLWGGYNPTTAHSISPPAFPYLQFLRTSELHCHIIKTRLHSVPQLPSLLHLPFSQSTRVFCFSWHKVQLYWQP